MVQLFGVMHTGWGYIPGILYNKVRLFDTVQKILHNAAVVSDAISRHTP